MGKAFIMGSPYGQFFPWGTLESSNVSVRLQDIKQFLEKKNWKLFRFCQVLSTAWKKGGVWVTKINVWLYFPHKTFWGLKKSTLHCFYSPHKKLKRCKHETLLTYDFISVRQWKESETGRSSKDGKKLNLILSFHWLQFLH